MGVRGPRMTGKKARVDISGQKFGMLTAVQIVGKTRDGTLLWEFRCDCTNVIVRQAASIRSEKRAGIPSCGCQSHRLRSESKTTHGLSRTREYQAWKNLLARCYDPEAKGYADYGGRGITVCERWRNSVEAFYADMGPKPSPKHEIDREDNEAPYSPENCHWAEDIDQANNKRNNLRIEFNGTTMTLAQWGRETGMKAGTIQARLHKGWTVEQALTLPLGSRP